MSSNIKITRICEFCNNEFLARTTKTRYCSHSCNQKHYKIKVRQGKITVSNKETLKKVVFPIEQLKAKEYLTVKEAAVLLNCSFRTVYNQINKGSIKAVNLGERLTRIKKSELDNIFK